MAEDAARILVVLTPGAVHLARDLGLLLVTADIAVNNRHHGLISDNFERMTVAHWRSDDVLVLVEGIVSDKEFGPSGEWVTVKALRVNLVLELRRDLPVGALRRDMGMEQIMERVADSFGVLVTAHPDHAGARLYSGPWDGRSLDIAAADRTEIHACATLYPDQRRCELGWAINLTQYRKWHSENFNPPPNTLRASDVDQHDAHKAVPLRTLRTMLADFPSRFPQFQVSPEGALWWMSASLLRFFLGDSWADKNLIGSRDSHPRLQMQGLAGC